MQTLPKRRVERQFTPPWFIIHDWEEVKRLDVIGSRGL